MPEVIVTGSYTNENLDRYDDEILAVYGELNGVETEEQAEEVIGRMKKIMENAVAENSDRLLGAVMLYNYYAQFAEPDEIARMIDTLAPDMQKNKGVEQLKKLCANARNGEIGATLADVRLYRHRRPRDRRFGDHRRGQMGARRLLGNVVRSLPRRDSLSGGGV